MCIHYKTNFFKKRYGQKKIYNNGAYYSGFTQYLDAYGNPVERPKDNYPYSYDPFVTWKKYDLPEKPNRYSADYSDRLHSNYPDVYKIMKKHFGDTGQYYFDRNPEDIERFLSELFKTKIELFMIMEGSNLSSGHYYWIFFYIIKTSDSEK